MHYNSHPTFYPVWIRPIATHIPATGGIADCSTICVHSRDGGEPQWYRGRRCTNRALPRKAKSSACPCGLYTPRKPSWLTVALTNHGRRTRPNRSGPHLEVTRAYIVVPNDLLPVPHGTGEVSRLLSDILSIWNSKGGRATRPTGTKPTVYQPNILLTVP